MSVLRFRFDVLAEVTDSRPTQEVVKFVYVY